MVLHHPLRRVFSLLGWWWHWGDTHKIFGMLLQIPTKNHVPGIDNDFKDVLWFLFVGEMIQFDLHMCLKMTLNVPQQPFTAFPTKLTMIYRS